MKRERSSTRQTSWVEAEVAAGREAKAAAANPNSTPGAGGAEAVAIGGGCISWSSLAWRLWRLWRHWEEDCSWSLIRRSKPSSWDPIPEMASSVPVGLVSCALT